MEETRVYSCPSCGAPMKYSISNEKLKCRFCSNTYDLEYIRTHFTEVTDEKLSDFNWIEFVQSHIYKDLHPQLPV